MSAARPRTAGAGRGTAVAAALAAALALAGCGAARNTLGTSASVCFKALPGAEEAVHKKGHLVGVRRIEASLLQQRMPKDPRLASLSPKSHLCVFAFQGSFQAGEVTLAKPTASGNYAVVALAGSHPAVVAAFVVDQLPTRFRHTRA